MALTARAQAGLAFATSVEGSTVAAYSESVLEKKGLEWADQADVVTLAKTLKAFDKAAVKATKEQILAEAAKPEAEVEVEVAEAVK